MADIVSQADGKIERHTGGLDWSAELRPMDGADLPTAARYGLAALMVAVAAILAFIVDHLVAVPNLSLIFVVPVTIAAMAFGWGPALLAVVASMLSFDFFFTEPRYSLRMTSPADLWSLALLTVIAMIVSTLAADARRRALEVRAAAEQAQALQSLAHMVVEARPRQQIVEAAAGALNRIFKAPAVILVQSGDVLGVAAEAGRPQLSEADHDAAQGALTTCLPARSETYPNVSAAFDFWPVVTPPACRCVVGVDFSQSGRERPAAPERFIDVVGAYLAAAFDRDAKAGVAS